MSGLSPLKSVTLGALGIAAASAESVDYVATKTQFQLHTLLTEQRHPATMTLSEDMQANPPVGGIDALMTVDQDIATKLKAICGGGEERTLLHCQRLVDAMERTIVQGRKIYVYGCGATGRLAKQVESNFWRPFWRDVQTQHPTVYAKLQAVTGKSDNNSNDINMQDQLIGEMTGADRALISSLEGFEDLLLIGAKQLQDHKIVQGDLIICVTEGGETSSVIGTVLEGLKQWHYGGDEEAFEGEKPEDYLFFIYNNPDSVLAPFTRSQRVLNNDSITKINLTTGPQSITGSTRMQATSSETFVVGALLHLALHRVASELLTPAEVKTIGFEPEVLTVETLLVSWFDELYAAYRDCQTALACTVQMEAGVYEAGGKATYFADAALLTVFIDGTERSPTFRLFPLDTVEAKERNCLIRIWTAASSHREAWNHFLLRPFKGLDSKFYQQPFETIADPYLKHAALSSLTRAGSEQERLYDFAFPDDVTVSPEDEEVVVCLMLEHELAGLADAQSYWRRLFKLFASKKLCLMVIAGLSQDAVLAQVTEAVPEWKTTTAEDRILVVCTVSNTGDPLRLRQQIALKMMLNTHSTAVMARLGKVVGNTMTNVSPSNLKLIGRATFLIQSHVNDALTVAGYTCPYPVANAVLFEAIEFVKTTPDLKKVTGGGAPEVALAIVRLVTTVIGQKPITNTEAYTILVQAKSLANFLKENSATRTAKL